MSLDVTCPGCGAAYELPDDLNGKRIRCKGCGEVFAAGDPQAAAPPATKRRAAGPSGLQREVSAQRGTPLPSTEPSAERLPSAASSSSHWWLWLVAIGVGGVGLATLCCVGTGLGISVLLYSGSSPSSVSVASKPSTAPPDAHADKPIDGKPADKPAAPRDERMKALHDGKFMQPPRNAAEDTSLRVMSDPGDFIGQGKTYSYGGDKLVVQKIQPSGLSISVDGWGAQFTAPGGGMLKTGEYLNAKRWPFNGNDPGIGFSGHGRGCNTIAGQFVVWELEMNGDQITRVAIDFMMKCEGNGPPLYGMLRYHSNFD